MERVLQAALRESNQNEAKRLMEMERISRMAEDARSRQETDEQRITSRNEVRRMVRYAWIFFFERARS